MNCLESQELLQQRLDGASVPAKDLLDLHLAGCTECRDLHSAAQHLLDGLRETAAPTAPSGLTDRIVVQVLAQQRKRLRFRRRVLAVTALAASLLLVAVAALLWPSREGNSSNFAQAYADDAYYRITGKYLFNRVRMDSGGKLLPQTAALIDHPANNPTATPALGESVSQAGEAVVSLTRRTADETAEQTRILLPLVPAPPTLDNSAVLPDALDPPARSLRQTGQSVSTGLEPVTDSARRAVDMFLRDLPSMEPETKPGL